MNKRIRKKQGRANFIPVKVPREWTYPHPAYNMAPVAFMRAFSYTSIDLSSPERRRAAFKGIVHEWEHRRVERAARRRDRRRRRRRWASVYGHMHREEDWMPRP